MEPVNEGDLVRVKGGEPTVFKVARLHNQRVGPDERRFVAECLLPPYDNPNRFENWPTDLLEKVPAEPPKAATK